MNETVFVIKRRDEGFVDKGGRKTLQLKNAFMWSNKEDAEAYMSRWQHKIYIAPGGTIAGFKVVPVTLSYVE